MSDWERGHPSRWVRAGGMPALPVVPSRRRTDDNSQTLIPATGVLFLDGRTQGHRATVPHRSGRVSSRAPRDTPPVAAPATFHGSYPARYPTLRMPARWAIVTASDLVLARSF